MIEDEDTGLFLVFDEFRHFKGILVKTFTKDVSALMVHSDGIVGWYKAPLSSNTYFHNTFNYVKLDKLQATQFVNCALSQYNLDIDRKIEKLELEIEKLKKEKI